MELVQICDDEWVFHDATIDSEVEEQFDEALEAHEHGDLMTANRIARNVVSSCPNHIDALHHLSLWAHESGDGIAAYAFCQAAVGIGLHAIPPDFSWNRSRLLWLELRNRPFLRAYDNLALHRIDQKDWTEAIAILTRLLAVNPNDNQGCRYVLPYCCFETGDLPFVINHCHQNRHDSSPFIQYSHALAHVLANQMPEARAAMEHAVRTSPLVAKELIANDHPEPERVLPGTYTVGGNTEAWDYWNQSGKFWDRSETAMTLLKEIVNATG